MLYEMNWEKKDEKDKIENQFMKTMSRLSRTQRCGLPELHGGRTSLRRRRSKSIIRSTLTIAVGASIASRAKQGLPNIWQSQVTVKDWE